MTGTDWVLVAWFTVCFTAFIRTAFLGWDTIVDLHHVIAHNAPDDLRMLAQSHVYEAVLRAIVMALFIAAGGAVVVAEHHVMRHLASVVFDGALLLSAVLIWIKSEADLRTRRRLRRFYEEEER